MSKGTKKRAEWSSGRGYLLEDEKPPVVIPLLARTQPDAEEGAPVAVVIEVQRVAAATGVGEELPREREWHHVVQLRTRRRQREVDAFLRRGTDFFIVSAPLNDVRVGHRSPELYCARLKAFFPLALVGEFLSNSNGPFAVTPPDPFRIGVVRDLFGDSFTVIHGEFAEFDDSSRPPHYLGR